MISSTLLLEQWQVENKIKISENVISNKTCNSINF